MPFLEMPGARIHYQMAGSGAGLVFIHGGCCSAADWRRQLPAFSAGRRVLAPDLRGHGGSTGAIADCTIERWAADINGLIDVQAASPAFLVGHSLGTRIVIEAACQRPDNAAGLILIDGSRSVGGGAASAPAAPGPAAPGIADLGAILEATIGPYADAATRGRIVATMSAAPPELMRQTVAAYMQWDENRADNALANLAGLPVLAIQSSYHDRFTPRRFLREGEESTPYLAGLRHALPQLETVILPETGHFSMLERSAEVNGLIQEFITKNRK